MSIFSDLQSSARKSGAPATVVLVFAIVGGYIVSWFSQGRVFGPNWAFHPAILSDSPWSIFTYTFSAPATGDWAIGILFAALWLWGMGASVERDIGAGRFVAFFFIMTTLGALAYFIGFLLLGPTSARPFIGPFMAIAAVTVVWGTRNPTACVQLMFVLPITGKWLAWVSAALVFLSTDSRTLAIFACVPLILAWAFAAEKLPIPYRAVPRDRRVRGGVGSPRESAYFDEVRKREQDRKERERLRKLFESSLDDPDKDR